MSITQYLRFLRIDKKVVKEIAMHATWLLFVWFVAHIVALDIVHNPTYDNVVASVIDALIVGIGCYPSIRWLFFPKEQ